MILRNGGKASKNIRFNEPLIQRFMVATPFPIIRDQRTLTGWVTPATENDSPASAGLFIWKGCDMKKYIPVDFDEKGNAVLGNAKSTPTSNGFIPTTWAPGGGGDEGKQGLKSISISPAITTTPALESFFPIYYDDLTEEQKQQGVTYSLSATNEPAEGTPVTITVTPTSDWYVLNDMAGTIGEKGQPMSFTNEYHSGAFSSPLPFWVLNEPPTGGAPEKYVVCRLSFAFS